MSMEYGAEVAKSNNLPAGPESSPKMVWAKHEDEILISTVEKKGKNWVEVAKEMHKQGIVTKSGKQCRERWMHQLDPSISKDDFTEAEMSVLFSMHKAMGNKWIDISHQLPGRTDNMIKNFYYATVRKEIKRIEASLKAIPEYNKITVTKSSYFKLQKIMELDILQLSKIPIDQIGAELLKIQEKKRKRRTSEANSMQVPAARRQENVEENKHIPTSQIVPQFRDFQSPSSERLSNPPISQPFEVVQPILHFQPHISGMRPSCFIFQAQVLTEASKEESMFLLGHQDTIDQE